MWKLFSFASVCRVPSSVLVRALNRYRGGHGFVSRTSLIFFSGFLFAIAKVASITAMKRSPDSQPTRRRIIWLCIGIYRKIDKRVFMQINSHLSVRTS